MRIKFFLLFIANCTRAQYNGIFRNEINALIEFKIFLKSGTYVIICSMCGRKRVNWKISSSFVTHVRRHV